METYESWSVEETPRESLSLGQRMRETRERLAKIAPKVSQIQMLLGAIFAYDIFVLKMCTKSRHLVSEDHQLEPIVLDFSL